MLFDCGEGTQRQMMRYGVSFSLSDIFFTHFHADHVIGVIGLMRTMALQGRTDVLRLWGPKGASRHLKRAELHEILDAGDGNVCVSARAEPPPEVDP